MKNYKDTIKISNFLKIALCAVFLFMSMLSCNHEKNNYGSIILQWTGKELLFPDSLPLADGSFFNRQPSDFLIVSYYDSEGCTGCNMKLPMWNRFMEKIDSIPGSPSVRLLLIVNTDNKDEIVGLIEKSGYNHQLVIDSIGRFNEANHLPKEEELRTFLIDSSNRIIALGNPIRNAKLGKLYHDIIAENRIDIDETDDYPILSYDFGRIEVGEHVSKTFLLTNESNDTIIVDKVLTSCECTQANVTPEKIAPNSKYKVATKFMDTIPGDFIRSIQITFRNKNPEFHMNDIHIELSGKINNL